MTNLIDAALDRSRTVLLALLLILISGTIAYITIPKESQPDVNIPNIYVSMTHEGISPEDAERLLVRPMEKELRSMQGVKEMRSKASEGHASVLLEFEAGFDVDTALQDVRERVDIAKNELPEDTKEASVNEVNVGLFPDLVVVLSGSIPERTLLKFARNLQEELEGLSRVLEADITGKRDEVLEIVVDPLRLESYNVRYEELLESVSRNNRLIAAGALDTGSGKFSVKMPGLFETLDDILSLPVKVAGDAVVTVADITNIRRTFKDVTTIARLDGRAAIAIEIKKRLGENVIDTIEDVRRVTHEKAEEWPDAVGISFIQDQSIKIRNMLTDLQNNILTAIILVMIVVIGALGIRSAGLVGVAIPGSFLTGILVISTLGLTMNIVVLFSLILAVGMLVDGAIVVTEFADRRMAEGIHRRDAYAQAAKRMAWPITASTATTLAAFMPLLFWPGVVGEFMRFLPITLIATLTASLAMAMIFVPTVGSYIGQAGSVSPEVLAALAAGENGDLSTIKGATGRYARMLSAVVQHPLKVLAAAVTLLIGVQTYYAVNGNGIEFFPNVEPEFGQILVHARGNLSVDEMDWLVKEVEQEVLVVPGIKTIYTRVGTQHGQRRGLSEDVVGVIQIEFKDWNLRRPANEIFAEIQDRTNHLAGITIEAAEPDVGPPTGKPVQIHFSSRYPEALEPVLKQVLEKMRKIDGLVDLEDTRSTPGIEWQIAVDREQASRFGADIVHVGNVVKLVTNGLKIDDYRPDDADEEVDIRVRYPTQERTLNQLDTLRVATQEGLIPISNFVEREPKEKVGIIKRTDSRRVLAIKADVAEGVLADDKVGEIRAWLDAQALDPRVYIDFKGEDEEQRKAEAFLLKAFGIALFIMAIILVTQFNSFYHAFLILSAVVMSTIGVMIGLIITGQAFSIVMTGIGVITLAGVVVNNNIVLIDTYDRLRNSGIPAIEAVVRTGAQRLRPVILTAVTTVLGLMPMVLGLNINLFTRDISVGGPSTQWWVQLATAVASGLTFATILTLVVTPTLLVLGANVGTWVQSRRDHWRSSRNPMAGSAETH